MSTNTLAGANGLLEDIAAERAVTHAMHLASRVYQAIGEAVLIVDREFRPLATNVAFELLSERVQRGILDAPLGREHRAKHRKGKIEGAVRWPVEFAGVPFMEMQIAQPLRICAPIAGSHQITGDIDAQHVCAVACQRYGGGAVATSKVQRTHRQMFVDRRYQ